MSLCVAQATGGTCRAPEGPRSAATASDIAACATADLDGGGAVGLRRARRPGAGEGVRECLAAGAAGQARRSNLCAARRCVDRSEEHTSELQSLMRSSYAVF